MKLSEMKSQTFKEKSLSQWKEAAEKALKGKSLETIHTKTYEGIDIKPLYTVEDVPMKNDRIKSYIPDLESKLEGMNTWYIAQRIKRDSWNELTSAVKESLLRGQNCLSFSIDSLPLEGFDTFFNEVIDKNKPVFTIEKINFHLINRLINLSKSSDIKEMMGIVGCDPISGNAFLQEDLEMDSWVDCVDKASKEIPGLKTIVVNTSPYHNHGANAVQELAYALSEGVTYIEIFVEKGWSIEEIAKKMHFNFSIGCHFFMEVAKLRAFKKLWHEVLSSYGVDTEKGIPFISTSAETSQFNKSNLDPYVNLLRSGGEGFAAVLGGVDYLVVLPFNEVSGETNIFSERIARNTQLILGEEAHLNKVIDPGGGSYYLEWLSEEVGKKSWKEFQMIQQNGGILSLTKKGIIQEDVRKMKKLKMADLSSRTQSMIGTNIYANLEDKSESVPSFGGERLSEPFEKLRTRSHQLSKNASKPIAGLIGLNDLKKHKPRTDFVSGFLAAGGIHSHVSKECFTLEDTLEFIKETKYPYYVICGDEEDYQTIIPLLLEYFNKTETSIVLDLAGKVNEERMMEWKTHGLNGSIYLKQNMIEKLNKLISIWEEGTQDDKA